VVLALQNMLKHFAQHVSSTYIFQVKTYGL